MRLRTQLPVLLFLLASCDGVIGDAARHADEDLLPTDPREVDVDQCREAAASVAAASVRRLTAREYFFTVVDTLGWEGAPPALSADGKVGGFEVNAGPTIGDLELSQLAETAERVADDVAAELPALAGCTTVDEACGARFVQQVGRRLFRRTLTAEEQARYEALFASAVGELGRSGSGALSLVVRAMLQSPAFLYRGEVGEPGVPGDAVPLTGVEIASRLSYFLWQSAPDDPLLDAAEGGELDAAEGVDAHVRRMLEDPRAERAIAEFHARWLWLRTGPDEARSHEPMKSPELYPGWDDTLLSSMVESFERFSIGTTLSGGTFEQLMTGRELPVDARLAEHLGATADGWSTLTAPERERAGVLTHPLTLTVHSHPDAMGPTWPGQLVRAQVLCQPLPPPPPDIEAPDVAEGLTRREIMELHANHAGCAGCHQMMDPIGFGFDSYDAVGRFREGGDVDPRGEILFSEDVDGEFVGVVELAHRLAGSEQAQLCYEQKWVSYALGREPTAEETCSLADVHDRFVSSGGVIEELLVAIATSDAFRHHLAPTMVCP